MSKIVFLTSRFPFPLDKGDKLRAFFQLQGLSKDNEIHLIAINENSFTKAQLDALAPYCASIQVFTIPLYKRIFSIIKSVGNGLPLQVAYFYCKNTHRTIEDIIKKIQPDVIHCHLIRTTEYIKNISSIPKSLDFMDAFALGMDKRASREKNSLKKWLWQYERDRLYTYEKNILPYFQSYCSISEQDSKAISPTTKIHTVANGVDTAIFQPKKKVQKYDVVFMGNMSYAPNIDAAHFIGQELLPVLLTHCPDIRILIAGMEPPNSVRKLQGKNIDIVDYFEDISDAIALSKIMIAPMFMSIGLQNKIVQAMAMKVPCIVTTAANNAIQAPIHTTILEANTPQEFSSSIKKLLENKTLSTTLGENGYEFVQKNFTWAQQTLLLKKVIQEAADANN